MYQRMGQAAYKANLDNTIKLLGYLDDPQHAFKSVHVAGTNGKGSSSHMLASVFQEAGYKVGLYTSPHLKDFRERIMINGKMIPKRKVSSFVKHNMPFFELNQLSFFEMTVGLAFDYFKSEKIDIAIIEVGLGGRLDSTNVIMPEVSVITNIGLDHTRFLGDSLSQIASEKGGIIKPGVPVVIGETQPETAPVFSAIAKRNKSQIIYAQDKKTEDYNSDLKGAYQKMNKKTVLVTLEVMRTKGWNLPEKAVVTGLKNVIKNTGLQGRWQELNQEPKVICDTAHNREGLQLVMEQLKSEKFKNLHIVLGAVDDKDLSSVLSLFPKEATYYFCRPDVPRGMDVQWLCKVSSEFGLEGEVYLSVMTAYKNALRQADKNDLIFVGGSTFVVAEVL
ncbi:bifunctional folylpolyglutamate synthase/dihydrofolate synthase [Ulvibacter antarcticus]|uniref:bifunctional folylpolyglutamate synthase/dihydrofolate synthase n=1 Tax=Ulvibacter antarcticus TaxID=442714 RepID=UPI0026C9637D